MRYFDFHAHIILKQLFSSDPDIHARIEESDVKGAPNWLSDLTYIIQSQIHMTDLQKLNDTVIIGIALYAVESNLAKEVKVLRKNLKKRSQHKLSEELLESVVRNDNKAFTNFIRELTLKSYKDHPELFNILKKESFNSDLPNDRINIYFVVEGCHSLVDTFNKWLPPNESFPPVEILNNIDTLLNEENINILSINLTHLQQSNLCNHAFGMQLSNPSNFFPRGNGLEQDGKTVVQGLFDRKIHVDVKHMSYKSRKDLMDAIDNNEFTNPMPLLCTHSGFTGIEFKDWVKYIKVKQSEGDVFYIETVKTMHTKNNPLLPAASFNMSTINLFNEEIGWIINKGGMIGLSLDRRIIGYVDTDDDKPTGLDTSTTPLFVDKEYISKEEWDAITVNDDRINRFSEDDCVQEQWVVEAKQTTPVMNRFFYDHVLLHLKHYFQACRDYSPSIPISKAQKQITIGSDLDGLINPFYNLLTIDDMPAVKKYIKDNFRDYLLGLEDSKQWADELNVDEFVEDLFYNNGFEFVKRYFSNT